MQGARFLAEAVATIKASGTLRITVPLRVVTVGIVTIHVVDPRGEDCVLETGHVLALPADAAGEVQQLFARMTVEIRQHFDEAASSSAAHPLRAAVSQASRLLARWWGGRHCSAGGCAHDCDRAQCRCGCHAAADAADAAPQLTTAYAFEHYWLPFMHHWAATVSLQGSDHPGEDPLLADRFDMARRMLDYLVENEMWCCIVLLLGCAPALRETVTRMGMHVPDPDISRLMLNPQVQQTVFVPSTTSSATSEATSLSMSVEDIIASLATEPSSRPAIPQHGGSGGDVSSGSAGAPPTAASGAAGLGGRQAGLSPRRSRLLIAASRSGSAEGSPQRSRPCGGDITPSEHQDQLAGAAQQVASLRVRRRRGHAAAGVTRAPSPAPAVASAPVRERRALVSLTGFSDALLERSYGVYMAHSSYEWDVAAMVLACTAVALAAAAGAPWWWTAWPRIMLMLSPYAVLSLATHFYLRHREALLVSMRILAACAHGAHAVAVSVNDRECIAHVAPPWWVHMLRGALLALLQQVRVPAVSIESALEVTVDVGLMLLSLAPLRTVVHCIAQCAVAVSVTWVADLSKRRRFRMQYGFSNGGGSAARPALAG